MAVQVLVLAVIAFLAPTAALGQAAGVAPGLAPVLNHPGLVEETTFLTVRSGGVGTTCSLASMSAEHQRLERKHQGLDSQNHRMHDAKRVDRVKSHTSYEARLF
jgi:hypothetical protein